MKYIFDFDDVLFNNTKQFKEHMYACLEKAGVPRSIAEEYYKEVREKEFSLKNFINTLLGQEQINKKTQNIYEEIMSECKNFVNMGLIEVVKKLGKENCYIVTNGEKEFQKDKIKRSELPNFFLQIHIVLESKKEIIYNICNKYKNEKVIFFEDKIKFIDDLDLIKCPNLRTVLYDEDGFKKLKAEKGLKAYFL